MLRKSIKSRSGPILWTVILNLLVCMIICTGCGPIKSTVDPNDKNFTVAVPKGWKVQPDKKAALAAINPLEGPSDTFPEIMLVIVEVMPINISLKRYMVALKDTIREMYFDSRVVEEGVTYLGGRSGRYMMFEYMGERNEILKGVVYAIKEKNRAYTLFFVSTRSEFDRHYMLFDHVKDTFKVGEL